ncbi:MAG: NUDIX domain-containing protein [Clostridia bacterium]|nr:NUDIX domain-containing protein [Clostridia bacterium]
MEKSSVDISFSVENSRFNFRVMAFICYKDNMLLSSADGIDFCNMPGGRVKMGESTLEAIKRELYEELDLVEINPKLIAVYENFFTWKEKDVQELDFIYKIDVDEIQFKRLENFCVKDSTNNERTHWVKKSQLKDVVCLPEIIYDVFDLKTDRIFHGIKKD